MGTMRSLPRTPSTSASEASSAVSTGRRRNRPENRPDKRRGHRYDERNTEQDQAEADDRYDDPYDQSYDDHADLDDEVDHGPEHEDRDGTDYVAVEQSPEFIKLRRRLLLFVFPVTFLFFSWYMAYILFAAYAHDFMSQRLFGSVTMGLVLGLGQYVSTILITLWYVSFAKRRIDPSARSIREQYEYQEDHKAAH
jgi:uncharacterized membrane protein (DUF485 family)